MDYPADSAAKLYKGEKGWYVGMEGVPMDNSSGEICKPVTVFESLDLPVSVLILWCFEQVYLMQG